MFKIFNKKALPLLGIDIGASSVKLIELTQVGKQYHLERFAVAPLSQNAVVDKNIADIDAVADSIKEAVKQAQTKIKHACVAVPSSAVITKTLLMPKEADDKELGERILSEGEQYIPYSLDEVSIDYRILGENEKEPGSNNVLLVAARREVVDTRAEAIIRAGLIPKIVDVETFAIENAIFLIQEQIPSYQQNKVVAIVDVGATSITFTVIDMETGRTIYTREQGGGGSELTQEIVNRYGIVFDEAEIAKRNGGLPDNYHDDILEPAKNKIIQSISRALQFFMSSSSHCHINCIALMGGGALISGLESQTESALGIKSFLINPFLNMQTSRRIRTKDIMPQAGTFLIACGLAMRSAHHDGN